MLSLQQDGANCVKGLLQKNPSCSAQLFARISAVIVDVASLRRHVRTYERGVEVDLGGVCAGVSHQYWTMLIKYSWGGWGESILVLSLWKSNSHRIVLSDCLVYWSLELLDGIRPSQNACQSQSRQSLIASRNGNVPDILYEVSLALSPLIFAGAVRSICCPHMIWALCGAVLNSQYHISEKTPSNFLRDNNAPRMILPAIHDILHPLLQSLGILSALSLSLAHVE